MRSRIRARAAREAARCSRSVVRSASAGMQEPRRVVGARRRYTFGAVRLICFAVPRRMDSPTRPRVFLRMPARAHRSAHRNGGLDMNRVLAAAVTFVLTVAGLTTVSTATAAPPPHHRKHHHHHPYTPPPVHWKACNDGGLLDAIGAQCAMVKVPLSYRHPHRAKIKIAISRLRHTSSRREVPGHHAGQPGRPGRLRAGLSVLGDLRARSGPATAYDWIGFDPRGVGSSRPSLSCDADYFGCARPRYVPDDGRDRAGAGSTRPRRTPGTARSAGGALLGHMKTTRHGARHGQHPQGARRAEAQLLRLLLRHLPRPGLRDAAPRPVRRFVLDGIVDPRGVWYRRQPRPGPRLREEHRVYFGWIADARRGLPPRHRPRGGRRALLRRAQRSWTPTRPRRRPRCRTSGTTSCWAPATTSTAGRTSPTRSRALRQRRRLRPGSSDLYDGDPTGPATTTATRCTSARQCTDAPGRSWAPGAGQRRVAPRRAVPDLGQRLVQRAVPFWPAGRARRSTSTGAGARAGAADRRDARRGHAVLGRLEVRKRFPSASLIAGVGGTTHAGSLSGVSCTDRAMGAYLANGRVPERTSGNQSDLQCPPVPQPDPQPEPAAGFRLRSHPVGGRHADSAPCPRPGRIALAPRRHPRGDPRRRTRRPGRLARCVTRSPRPVRDPPQPRLVRRGAARGGRGAAADQGPRRGEPDALLPGRQPRLKAAARATAAEFLGVGRRRGGTGAQRHRGHPGAGLAPRAGSARAGRRGRAQRAGLRVGEAGGRALVRADRRLVRGRLVPGRRRRRAVVQAYRGAFDAVAARGGDRCGWSPSTTSPRRPARCCRSPRSCAAAREAGALSLVDAAHVPGHVEAPPHRRPARTSGPAPGTSGASRRGARVRCG